MTEASTLVVTGAVAVFGSIAVYYLFKCRQQGICPFSMCSLAKVIILILPEKDIFCEKRFKKFEETNIYWRKGRFSKEINYFEK